LTVRDLCLGKHLDEALLPNTTSPHMGLQLLSSTDILVDVTGDAPASGDKLILDVSTAAAAVPGPIAGAGLPGLILAPSRLVATAAEDRLSIKRNPLTSFAAASDCRTIAIYEYTPPPPATTEGLEHALSTPCSCRGLGLVNAAADCLRASCASTIAILC
jgi:hypothetical protein